MSKLEKALYYSKYTAGSYLDAFISIPIWAAEKISKGSEKVLKGKNPSFFSWDNIQKESLFYRHRENLRASLDTKPGALFLQSNAVGSIPFILVGMYAAEFMQYGIDKYIPNAPEIAKYATNSLATIVTQMLVSYTTFMVNEVRVNKDKYTDENSKLSIRKMGNGFKNAVKAFLTFDLSYTGLKTIGQSAFLALGKDPWKASGMFDSLALPLGAAIVISLGLKNGIIETKGMERN